MDVAKQIKPARATLFVQCLVDGFFPQVAEAMVAILRRLGLAVDFPPDQTCCGQPAFNAGQRRAARRSARHFVTCFERAEVIVCPSGSCVSMVRHHYPTLFRDQPRWRQRAEQMGRRTFEFSEFLVDVLGVTDVGARARGRITYHDSCHLLRSLGVQEQPRRLISAVQGIEFVDMHGADLCCGFGGSFAVKYPDISTAMVDAKIDKIMASGADTVVGADMGCLMNIGGRLRRRGIKIDVMHLAQLLNQAGMPGGP